MPGIVYQDVHAAAVLDDLRDEFRGAFCVRPAKSSGNRELRAERLSCGR